MGWEDEVRVKGISNFKDWLGFMMENNERQHIEQMVILLWLIWKSRNAGIFHNSSWGAEKICLYGQQYFQELQIINSRKEELKPMVIKRRSLPPENLLKINVDGAFSAQGTGIGLVVRNDKGCLEAVMTERLSDCFDAEHVETLAMMKAVLFAKEVGITHFFLEVDAVSVITKIKRKETDLSRVGHVIAGIKLSLSEFPYVQIEHVTRKNNEPAHLAAKLALESTGCKIWFMDFPKFIVSVGLNDLKQ